MFYLLKSTPSQRGSKIPPLKFIPVVTVILELSVVLIVFPVIFILPAVTALTFRSYFHHQSGMDVCNNSRLCRNNAVELALNVPSVLNSLIVAPPSPSPTAPSKVLVILLN